MKIKWITNAKYRYPAPTFMKTGLLLLENHYPQFRMLGEAKIETRVNGKGTAFSEVMIYVYGNGKHTLHISRHWKADGTPVNEAKSWCSYILNSPPLNFDTEWDTSTEMLNGECREQFELASNHSKEVK